MGIEPMTSSLPMTCSTTELQGRMCRPRSKTPTGFLCRRATRAFPALRLRPTTPETRLGVELVVIGWRGIAERSRPEDILHEGLQFPRTRAATKDGAPSAFGWDIPTPREPEFFSSNGIAFYFLKTRSSCGAVEMSPTKKSRVARADIRSRNRIDFERGNVGIRAS